MKIENAYPPRRTNSFSSGSLPGQVVEAVRQIQANPKNPTQLCVHADLALTIKFHAGPDTHYHGTRAVESTTDMSTPTIW
jgi:hypothetical protein